MDNITKAILAANKMVGITSSNEGFSFDNSKISNKMIIGLIKNKNQTLKATDDDVLTNLLDKILENKRKTEELLTTSVAPSLTKAPESVPLSLIGVPQIPNDIEKRLLKNFCMAFDSNKDPVYFIRSKTESGHFKYTRISVTSTGKMDVLNALISSKLFESKVTKFAKLLSDLEIGIVNCFNNNKETLLEYVMREVPMSILLLDQVFVRCWKQDDDEGNERLIAASVQWSNLENPNYSDFVEFSIKKFGTLVIEVLPKIPTIYGNGECDSLNTFEIEKYKSDTRVDMSDDWKMYFARFSKDEARVYRAWIWAVLDANNHGRQALIIQDIAGYSAKSVFADVMVRFLGDNLIAAISKDTLTNQFWGAKIWDKRLIIAGDTKNDSIMRSEKMHLILGGDYTDIEFKGQKSFAVKLNSKVLINTNNIIEIDPSLKHELTRTIIIKTKITKEIEYAISAKDENGVIIRDSRGNAQMAGDHKFGDRLLATIDTMLVNAYQDYKILCPTDTEIVLPESVLTNLYNLEPVETTAYDSIINRSLEITNNQNDIYKLDDMYNYYFNIVKDRDSNFSQYNNTQAFKNFKNFLMKNHNIECKKMNVGDKRVMCYVGIKLKYETSTSTKSFKLISESDISEIDEWGKEK